MRLVGRCRLTSLRHDAPEACSWLRNWIAEVENAHWKRPGDVTDQFPRARAKPHGVFVFTVGQHAMEVELLISFGKGVAIIIDTGTDK